MCHGSPCRSTEARIPSGQPRAQALRVRVGLGRQDLGQVGARRGHRERVAEDRAAGRDQVRRARRPGPCAGRGPRRSRRSCPRRRTARRRRSTCRIVTRSGSQAPRRVSPPGADDLRVGLVEREQRAGLAGQSPERVVEPVVGQEQPDVVRDRGLRQHERDVAPLERARQRLDVVERDDDRAARRRSAGTPRSSGTSGRRRRARPAPRRSGRGTCRRT